MQFVTLSYIQLLGQYAVEENTMPQLSCSAKLWRTT